MAYNCPHYNGMTRGVDVLPIPWIIERASNRNGPNRTSIHGPPSQRRSRIAHLVPPIAKMPLDPRLCETHTGLKRRQFYIMLLDSAVLLAQRTFVYFARTRRQLQAERSRAEKEIERLDAAIAVFEKLAGTNPRGEAGGNPRRTRKCSTATLRKMAKAQKGRWQAATRSDPGKLMWVERREPGTPPDAHRVT